ncbi:hypothetical protein HanRHA438_Chr10g0456121 [Helianthus annuus]|nr:hypothetical protein HanRHA438_Chr10g0456121 [Helianthus annuus]
MSAVLLDRRNDGKPPQCIIKHKRNELNDGKESAIKVKKVH